MALYNIAELINQLSILQNDGYIYADIIEIDDDELPDALSFCAYDATEQCNIDYDEISAISDDANLSKVSIDSSWNIVPLSINELSVAENAIKNSLDYFKKDPEVNQLSRDDKERLKSLSMEMRNLQAKIIKIMKRYNI